MNSEPEPVESTPEEPQKKTAAQQLKELLAKKQQQNAPVKKGKNGAANQQVGHASSNPAWKRIERKAARGR